MGIIVKQGIRGSIYAYVGVVLGFLISSILMPYFLSTEQIGAVRLIESYGGILTKIASVGLLGVTLKYFPFFKDPSNNNNGFLRIIFGVPAFGYILTILVFILGMEYFLAEDLKNALFESVVLLIIPYTFARLFYELFDSFRRSLLDAVIGIITRDIIQRIAIIICLVGFYYAYLSFYQFVLCFILVHLIPGLVMLFKSISDGSFNLKEKIKLPEHPEVSYKKMISYGAFTFLTGFSGILMQTIDGIMINKYLGLGYTGIYFVMFYFGVLISIPSRALLKIAQAILAIDIKNGDLASQIKMLKSTSITLTFTGIILLVLLWSNIQNVVSFLPEIYEKGKYVVLLIGLAKLIQMMPGTTMMQLYLSKYYKFHLLSSVLFIILLIISNIILIPKYGITGAALASVSSRLLIAIVNQIFYYRFFKEQPFSYKTLICIFSGLFIYFIISYIPQASHFIIDIAIRSSLIISFFLVLNLSLNIVTEYNELFYKYLPFLKKGKS